MNLINYIFSIAFLLFCTSCEKIIYFDVATQEGKLVVNSFLGPQSGSIADVSLSIAPLDDDTYPEYITDATLELFKNDVFLDAYTYDAVFMKYTIDEAITDAHAGDVFKLMASVPGKDPVTAETTIPQQIEIFDIRIADTVLLQSEYVYYDSLGNPIYSDSIPYYKIEIEFTDPYGENYYSLEAKYEDAISAGTVCYTTDDPVYTIGNEFTFSSNDENTVYTICENSYFTDLTFEGTKKTFTLYVILVDGIFFPDAKYIFTLKHVSKEYYNYYSTVNLQQSTEGDPFAQPVSIFSNIQGGFGIFASYNESVSEVEL